MLNIRIPTLVMFAIVALTSLFVVLNWQAILTPTELSFGIATINLPLGMVMLSLLTLIVAMFLIYIVYLQGQALFEARRFARDLRANQERADNAEASRFTEVHKLIREEMAKLASQEAEHHAASIAALELGRRELDARIGDTVNTVAAYVGELEDRIEPILPGKQANP